MIATRQLQRGFALPTILIASVVMLIVLAAAVSATASIRSALDGQYYNRLAREAAESGLARANACLQESAFIVQWSDANKLHPNTGCSGGAACANDDSCFVMKTSTIRTTFDVGQPTSFETAQTIVAIGKVELLRPSGAVWRTFTATSSARVGVDLNLNTVAFGYDGRVASGGGAYFATIAADGKMRAAGFNMDGQLGNGTTTGTTVPTLFQLNAADRAAAIYTNFISQGYNMFAITDKGTVYGAGLNDTGQLGDGTTTSRSIPVQFGLPAGVKATHVGVGGHTTYVTGSDNRLYVSGECSYGMLGTTYTITGCSNRTTYAAVALPTPNVNDLNTLPTNDVVFDRNTGFVRMQGGRVYGWGRNDRGQLADGTTTDRSTPVQIGTYGDTGQPRAVSIAFDGDTIYVVDSDGKVKASGRNAYGELGGNKVPIMLTDLNKCIDNKSQNGIDVQFYTCNGSPAQQWTFRSDQSLYNPNVDKCLENKNADGTTLWLTTCSSGNAKQKFVLQDDGTIINPSTGKCLNNFGGDGVTIALYACTVSVREVMSLPIVTSLVDVPLPAGAGKPVKVTTDQGFTSVLTDTGQVWSFGLNNRGQLGNGAVSYFQPYPVRFVLPSGVTATDMWTAGYNVLVGDGNNTFVIGSDGKVYGAGANPSGQLGDGTTTDRSTPVAMNVIDGAGIRAKSVQSGFGTTIVLTYGKKLYTVGNNSNGQLGDGTTTNSSTPKANKYTNVLPVAIF
jgi:alpha-tubulin suppressor-like RCC1 family protein